MNAKKLLLGVLVLAVLIVGGSYAFKNFVSKQNPVSNPFQSNSSGVTTVKDSSGKEIQVQIPPAPKFSGKQVVNLTKNGFDPQSLSVSTGTLVQWINKSGEDGTVNSDDYPTNRLYPNMNLGKFPDGSSVSVIFDKAGTYKYHNQLHPEQTGTVVVK